MNAEPHAVRGPLEGMTVVDLTKSAAGPYCTMLLADLGANVVKIEKPMGGDDIRNWGPPFWGDYSTAFLSFNRNKKSLALDIRHPDGQEALWDLIESADVLVQNLRPGALDQLGFGYGAVHNRNEALIYCSMTAYGSTGPMRNAPGYDPLLQAFSGLMSITGSPDGPPVRVGTSVIDMGMGMWGALGVLAATIRVRQTGHGELVETSLFETATSWIPYQILGYLATDEVPGRHGSSLPILAPYEAYPTRSGDILIAAGNNGLWAKLCHVLNADVLTTDHRFLDNSSRVRHRAELYAELCIGLECDTSESWLARLSSEGVPCAPIQSIDQVLAHPQFQALDILRAVPNQDIPGYNEIGVPLRWDGARPESRTVPPSLGRDTRELMQSLGRSDGEIDRLIARGVLFADDSQGKSRH